MAIGLTEEHEALAESVRGFAERNITSQVVRAALEALELGGRGPTVEELNGEGFPYSPYVLRRPELLDFLTQAPGEHASFGDSVAALTGMMAQ